MHQKRPPPATIAENECASSPCESEERSRIGLLWLQRLALLLFSSSPPENFLLIMEDKRDILYSNILTL